MAQTMGRNMAAPLLFLNLIMYFILLGFASWCINRYINGTTYHPSMGGNGATPFFLTFAMLTAVMGVASKLAGLYHIRAWRSDSLAGAGSTSLLTWAVTVLAFGLACKQISIGGHRGWRLRVVEAFIIILTITQLLYLLLLHAGIFSRRYGPGYWDTDYGMGGGTAVPGEPPKGTAGTRVV
ncbi:uncharacterized protein LOC111460317 [Cucurbita moschata]|uniref:Uncharacterized protein LOC111460317 n=1 Tax=Cucurbita moschata TaxID=3662 RepID=A0A6J1H5I7_CUCMO|nr:uncharacterized protein LOC111460317 [Cucurbita moschata]